MKDKKGKESFDNLKKEVEMVSCLFLFEMFQADDNWKKIQDEHKILLEEVVSRFNTNTMKVVYCLFDCL